MDRPVATSRATSVHLYGSFVLLAKGLLWFAPFDVMLTTWCANAASHIAVSTIDELPDASAAVHAEYEMLWVLWFVATMLAVIQVHLASAAFMIMGNEKSIYELAVVSGKCCRGLILVAVIIQTIVFLCILRIADGIFFAGMRTFQQLGGSGYLIVRGNAIAGVLCLTFCWISSYVAIHGH